MKFSKLFKSVRYLLATVNTLFLLTGLLLLLTGVVVLVQYSTYEDLLTSRFSRLPTFVIATGAIILAVSVLGYYGAFSEQFYFIAGYVILLLVVLIFEVAIIIASFSLKNDAVSAIRSPMSQSIQQYGTRIEVAQLWDSLQIGFECCGVVGRNDYVTAGIPVSCCHIDYGTVSPFQCTSTNSFTNGCAAVLGAWLSQKTHVMAINAIVATCLQVMITATSAWLAWRTKYEEVELEH